MNKEFLHHMVLDNSIDEAMRDFYGITPDQISNDYLFDEFDPKFRSAAVAPPMTPVGFQFENQCLVPQLLQPPSELNFNFNLITKQSEQNYSVISPSPSYLFLPPTCQYYDANKVVTAPEKPFHLVSTHFETSQSLDEVILVVTSLLTETGGISYEFDQQAYLWRAVFARGSCFSKFQINVYTANSLHIVEANRLKGDSRSFHSIYDELKQKFEQKRNSQVQQTDEEVAYDQNLSGLEISLQPPSVTDNCGFDDSSTLSMPEALIPILNMARQPFMEAQLEAARLLCDLSQVDAIRQDLCDVGAIGVLATLALSADECVCQCAVMSLANLSENLMHQELIVNSGVLPCLFSLACDGPYNSCETRKAAAIALANLSTHKETAALMMNCTAQLARRWTETVPTIENESLRMHAERARVGLVGVMAF